MNSYTGTPVNTVLFDAFFALLLGLLAFAGGQATNAIFAIGIIALYIAYSIPIAARFLGDNNFKPGPFNLGILVRLFLAVLFLSLTLMPIRVCQYRQPLSSSCYSSASSSSFLRHHRQMFRI